MISKCTLCYPTMQVVLMCLFLSAWSVRGEEGYKLPDLSQSQKGRLDRIKSALRYTEWQSTDRNGWNLYVAATNMAQLVCLLLPSDVKCETEAVAGEIPTCRVHCARENTNGVMESIAFNVWLCPSIEIAREGVLRWFLNVSAPLPYLIKEWEREDVRYGDRNFGSSVWVSGNVMFELTDGGANRTLVTEVFSSIDKTLQVVPMANSNSTGDIGVAVTGGMSDSSWAINLPRRPVRQQMVISTRNATLERLSPDVVIAKRKEDDKEVVLRFVVIEREKELRAYNHRITPGVARTP